MYFRVTAIVFDRQWHPNKESVFATLLMSPSLASSKKDDFKARLSSVRDLLSPQGGSNLDNLSLTTVLFELAEAHHGRRVTTETPSDSHFFLPNSGMEPPQ